MTDTIKSIAVGATGVAASLGAKEVIPTPDEITMFGQLLIQLAIGIATIWRLFKKPKKEQQYPFAE
jgi:hypothetical protein